MPKASKQTAPAGATTNQPTAYLAEVFGFPADVRTPAVDHFRSLRLCPFRPIHPQAMRDLSTPHERIPFDQQFSPCTKNSKKNPLGVCSVLSGDVAAITCPVRFSEGGVMVKAASEWSAAVMGLQPSDLLPIPEVRLVPASDIPDPSGNNSNEDGDLTPPEVAETSAGNIDYVLANIDNAQPHSTLITDYAVNAYAALEVQAVYISGNVRNLFTEFMGGAPWDGENSPRPDWLSSSRKRLVPQLAWKGSILHEWSRPIAVSVQQAFWDTMPYLQKVTTNSKDGNAYREMAWVIVDLQRRGNLYHIQHVQTVYSTFNEALTAATQTPAGSDRLVRTAILKKAIKAITGKNAREPRKAKAPAQGARSKKS